MAARGMRSAAELARDKPCGTRVRYYAGCRCDACRKANTAYERTRAEARARGERNGLVSAERARAHLAWLSACGVGRKTAADAAKVAPSSVHKVIIGERLQIREQTERRILAVTLAVAADRALIDGTATLARIAELMASGYSRARIASEIYGRPVRALQICASRVTVRTAERVRQAHERLRHIPADPTQALLQELSDEGFHRNRVARLLADLAAERRFDAPDMTVRKGGIRQQTAELVSELHRRLVVACELGDGEVQP